MNIDYRKAKGREGRKPKIKEYPGPEDPPPNIRRRIKLWGFLAFPKQYYQKDVAERSILGQSEIFSN